MAYDEQLADRVRAELDTTRDVAEKKMFGGLAFLIAGNMAVGVSHTGNLMVRVAPEDGEALVGPGVEAMVMQGRTMRGWLYVSPSLVAADDALAEWVARGAAFSGSLPPK